MRTTRGRWVATGAAIAMFALGACSQKTVEPFRDAPTSPDRNKAPARVIDMPDGFSNMAEKCDGPNMVISMYHGNDNRGSITVVKDDPRCVGK